MKYFLLLFLLVAPVFADLPVEQSAKSRTVHISAITKKGKEVLGTGTWISANYVATAEHVIEGCKSYSFYFNDEKIPATIAYSSPKQDIAILKSSKPSKLTTVVVADPIVGEEVFFWSTYDDVRGVNENLVPVLNKGFVAAVKLRDEGEDEFLINTYLLPGASGSGVFNERGEFLGVVKGTRMSGKFEWYATATEPDVVRNAMQKAKVQ